MWQSVIVILGASVAIGCSSPRIDDDSGRRAGRETGSSVLQRGSVPLRRSEPSLNDRTSWRPVLTWPDACEEAFQNSHVGQDAGLVFNELSPGISLVEVLCAAGSYQPSFVYVRLDERLPTPSATVLRFPVYESPDGLSIQLAHASELWGEPSVWPGRRELTVLNLARQTADCGIWTRYSVGDRVPEILEARSTPCSTPPKAPVLSSDGQPPSGWTSVRARQQ